MKTFWTPWRIDHVLGNVAKSPHCLFEPIVDTCNDKNTLLLFRDSVVIVLLNRFPYANGHLLVAPVRHVSCITELSAMENGAVIEMVKISTDILRKNLHPEGFNIGLNIGAIAGAGISDHLHYHIVPRWANDHNFISVIADLRTIPEHIEATFEKLSHDFLILNKR